MARPAAGFVRLVLLAAARFVSFAAVGLPGTFGLVLHGGEIAGLVLGLLAWRRLGAEGSR